MVVENVERWLEHGLRRARRRAQAMDEVTGPIVAVALVLCAVFVPCAFVGGITGQFFRQFAVTIAVSTVFSAINSLTLSPALAAILLKPRGGRRDPLAWFLTRLLGWFFRGVQSACFGTEHLGAIPGSIGLMMRFSGAGAARLWWAVGVDVSHLLRGADRLCAAAGSRPIDLQRSIARFVVAAADEAVLKQVAEIATKHQGRGAHRGHRRACRSCSQATSPNFASMFIVLEAVRRSGGDPRRPDTAIMADLRRRMGQTNQRRRGDRLWRIRRFLGWAWRADSR